jgi:hypothetical protein
MEQTLNRIRRDLPVFVSQFCLSDANGSGEPDVSQGALWLDMLDDWQISYLLSNLSPGDSSALLSSDAPISDWETGDLTISGQWVMERLNWIFQNQTASDSESSSTWTLENGCVATVSETPSVYGYPESCEYVITLSNPTASPVNSWRIRFTWDTEISSHQDFFSCEIGGSGNSRLIIPKDYNTVILPGASVNFGFSVIGESAPGLIDVRLE